MSTTTFTVRNYVDRYSNLIARIFGEEWQLLQPPDSDGILGVCIVQAVLDGVRPRLKDLARFLGVEDSELSPACSRLAANGVLLQHRMQDANGRVHFRCKLEDDRHVLESDNDIAWCYYAGYASGDTGKCAA